jgi:hypothetical protein
MQAPLNLLESRKKRGMRGWRGSTGYPSPSRSFALPLTLDPQTDRQTEREREVGELCCVVCKY